MNLSGCGATFENGCGNALLIKAEKFAFSSHWVGLWDCVPRYSDAYFFSWSDLIIFFDWGSSII